MIAYDLQCTKGHSFEGWFEDRKAYLDQQKKGLVTCPVIAVPTSVGYGASFGGLTALLAMLNSCAAGVTVVNIDNGFGAGFAAARINAIEKEIIQ